MWPFPAYTVRQVAAHFASRRRARPGPAFLSFYAVPHVTSSLRPPRSAAQEPAAPQSGVATGKPLPDRKLDGLLTPRSVRIGIGALVVLAIARGRVGVAGRARAAHAPHRLQRDALRHRAKSAWSRSSSAPATWCWASGPAPRVTPTARTPDFIVSYPLKEIDGLAARAEAAGVTLTLENAPGRTTPRSVLTMLIQLALLLGRGVRPHPPRAQRQRRDGAGRHRRRATSPSQDVAGTQGAAEELREMVDFLRAPDRFAALGARIPKGALLVGPPGTGKTLLARAVAGEAGVPFFSISGSEVTGFLVGMGAHRLKTLFKRARKKGGVIFIDEIDALGGKRGRNRSRTTRTTARSTSCWWRWTASTRWTAWSSSPPPTGRTTWTRRSSVPAASTAW